jgi:hypothetical protein
MMTIAILPTMRAYSMAVAPESQIRKRMISLLNESSPGLGGDDHDLDRRYYNLLKK